MILQQTALNGCCVFSSSDQDEIEVWGVRGTKGRNTTFFQGPVILRNHIAGAQWLLLIEVPAQSTFNLSTKGENSSTFIPCLPLSFALCLLNEAGRTHSVEAKILNPNEDQYRFSTQTDLIFQETQCNKGSGKFVQIIFSAQCFVGVWRKTEIQYALSIMARQTMADQSRGEKHAVSARLGNLFQLTNNAASLIPSIEIDVDRYFCMAQ